jgi:hypothetical protein
VDGNWVVNKEEMIIYKLVPTLNTWPSIVIAIKKYKHF